MKQRTISPGRRYREIARALARHGFGVLVHDLGLGDLLGFYRRARIGRFDEEDMVFLPERIRQVLEDLGPTFVKIGQFLSTRSDVIPEEIISELRKLQESATPIPTEEVRQVLERNWEKPLKEVCHSFAERPIGAASIGQVHHAVLLDGSSVAIKVRRPNIVPMVQADLRILADIAILAEQRWEWARRMNLIKIVQEFTEAMNQEMNYQREAVNILRIARQNLQAVKVPSVYRELSSAEVLVMEFIDGIRLDDKLALEVAGVNCEKIAEQLIDTMLKQMLEFGYYHADPHPGNIRVIAPNTILFLDFGLIGRLGKETRHSLSSLIICLMMDDNQGIADILIDMGAVSGKVDKKALRRDVEQLRQEYYGIPLEEVHIGEALEALWKVAARHQVRVPPNMALLARTVMTLEGVVREMVPKFNILSVAEPYAWRLLAERLNPIYLLQEGWSKGTQAIRDWTKIPQEYRQLVEDMRAGKIPFHLTPEWQQRITSIEKNQRKNQRLVALLGIIFLMVVFVFAPKPEWLVISPVPYFYEFFYGIGAVLLLWFIKLFFFD